MFSWLKKIMPTSLRKPDPTFGSMIYMESYWEGAGVFPPSGEEVEFFIAADERGPTSMSYSNFDEICTHFVQIQSGAIAAISTAVQESDLHPAKVTSLDVPAESLSASEWEISFSAPTGTLYTVTMRGHQATGKVEVS